MDVKQVFSPFEYKQIITNIKEKKQFLKEIEIGKLSFNIHTTSTDYEDVWGNDKDYLVSVGYGYGFGGGGCCFKPHEFLKAFNGYDELCQYIDSHWDSEAKAKEPKYHKLSNQLNFFY